MQNKRQEKARRKNLAAQAFSRNTQRKVIAIALGNCEWIRTYSRRYKASYWQQKARYREQIEMLHNLIKGNSGAGWVLFKYCQAIKPARKEYLEGVTSGGFRQITSSFTHTRAKAFKTKDQAEKFKAKYKLDAWTVE